MAPESLVNPFDNTEIEEALLLHVQALSDAEREAIAVAGSGRSRDDRAGRARRRRRRSCALHGRHRAEADPEPGHPNPGEAELTVGDGTFRKGGKVVLRPGTDRDLYDGMLDGRTATIERIYIDYEDAVHIG